MTTAAHLSRPSRGSNTTTDKMTTAVHLSPPSGSSNTTADKMTTEVHLLPPSRSSNTTTDQMTTTARLNRLRLGHTAQMCLHNQEWHVVPLVVSTCPWISRTRQARPKGRCR
jgi:hypothetical protein